MKKVHYAGIPCKSQDTGITYSHHKMLITCKECKDFLSGKIVEVETVKKASNDKRRTKDSK